MIPTVERTWGKACLAAQLNQMVVMDGKVIAQEVPHFHNLHGNSVQHPEVPQKSFPMRLFSLH